MEIGTINFCSCYESQEECNIFASNCFSSRFANLAPLSTKLADFTYGYRDFIQTICTILIVIVLISNFEFEIALRISWLNTPSMVIPIVRTIGKKA